MPKPRIRSIKPDLADSEKVARLSDEAFRVFICAITQADDAGSFQASDGHILRFLGFRGGPPRFAAVRRELVEGGFVTFYSVRGLAFGRICGWADHQRIDNARKDPTEYYPNPDDGEIVSEFPVVESAQSEQTRRPPRAAASRREPPRAAAGLDRIGLDGIGDLLVDQSTERVTESDLIGVYERYPRKVGRQDGLAELKKSVQTSSDLEACHLALKHFAAAHAGQEQRFIRHFDRWARRWRDWVDPATATPIASAPRASPSRDVRVGHVQITGDEQYRNGKVEDF